LQHPRSVGDLLRKGQQLHYAGDIRAAELLYREVLARTPDHPEALFLLGTALLQLGQSQAAVDRLERAARAQRHNPRVLGNLAQAYFSVERYADAENAFRKASRVDPRNVTLQLGIASAVAMQGRPGDAETMMRRLADRFPDTALVWLNLGDALRNQARLEDAIPCYTKALAIDPHLAEAHNNLGRALHALYRFDEAERAFRACLAADPEYSAAQYNLASVLMDVGRFGEAEATCGEILKHSPSSALAHTMRGSALGHQGQLRSALDCHRRAQDIAPQDAKLVENVGAALSHLGEFDHALKWFSRALSLDPGSTSARAALGDALLAQGRLSDGWLAYAHRPPVSEMRASYPEVAWSRELPPQLAGKHILLMREQGLGDEIFFLRFAPALAAAGAVITCCANRKIRSLLERVGCLTRVVEPDAPLPATDLVMLLGDLPRALSAWPASVLNAPAAGDPDFAVPQHHSWISVFWPLLPPSLRIRPLDTHVATIRQRLAQVGDPPYIGVTWRAGTPPREQRGGHDWKLFKEIAPGLLENALRELPGTLLALQRNTDAQEIERISRALGRPLHDFTALNEDLESMLAVLALIDEYIAVSNTNVHLRAAAGKTARVLVPRPAEWRWMAWGPSSPWFPGFSIYRQSVDGDWTDALVRLRADLNARYR